MKKKVLSVLLAACLLLGCVPMTAGAVREHPFSGACGENAVWSLNSEGELIIEGSGPMYDYTWGKEPPCPWRDFRDKIRSVIIRPGVTSIGENSFFDCLNLASVSIPDGLVSVGGSAFHYCPALTAISLPASVTKIDSLAFHSCSSLPAIRVAEDNPRYSSVEGILYNKDVTMLICCPGGKTGPVVIPESVAYIDAWGFCDCAAVTSIAVPPRVTTIYPFAFLRCDSLTSITVAEDNPVYSSLDGLLYNDAKTRLLQCPCGKTGEVTLPASVTQIESLAFQDCAGLTSILVEAGSGSFSSLDGILYNVDRTQLIQCPEGKTGEIVLPDSLSRLNESAFYQCHAITTVKIPKTITDINLYAFPYCPSLTSILVDQDNPEYTSVDGVLYNKDVTELLQAPEGKPGTVTIPSTVTEVGYYAFSGCSCLTAIQVEEGNAAYSSRDGFLCGADGTELLLAAEGREGKVSIPNGVVSIGETSFCDRPRITSVSIPGSVKTIDEYAFADCEALTAVTIDSGASVIKKGAFTNCPQLKTVIIPESVTAIGENVFLDSDQVTIYGKSGSYAETYANANKIPFAADLTPTPPAGGGSDPEPEPDPAPTQFVDVKPSDYFCDAVKWAVENGITEGTDKTHFSPQTICTRAQAVTFLWNAAGQPEPQSAENVFADVKPGAYYEKAVQWAVENGITSGTSETAFSPENPCTRAQIVTFLYRAEHSPETALDSGFSDVKPGAYYENAVKWAVEQNITSGTGSGKFSPNDGCIRGQIVTFLYHNYAK